MNKLLQLIQQKYKDAYDYQCQVFLNDFLSNRKFESPLDFYQITPEDFLTAFLISWNEGITEFDELKELTNKMKKLKDVINNPEKPEDVRQLWIFLESSMKKEINLDDIKKTVKNGMTNPTIGIDKVLIQHFNSIFGTGKNATAEKLAFIELCTNYYGGLDAFAIFLAIQFSALSYHEKMNTARVGFFSSKTRQDIMKEEMAYLTETQVTEVFAKIIEKLTLLNIDPKEERTLREKQKYKKIETILKEMKPGTMIDYNQFIHNIPNEDVLSAFLEYVFQNNATLYKAQLNNSLLKMAEEESEIQKAFLNYGFNIEHLPIEVIERLQKEGNALSIEKLLGCFKSDHLSFINEDTEGFVDLLFHSSFDIVNAINGLAGSKTIDCNFIRNHIGILLSSKNFMPDEKSQIKDPLYDILINNISLLSRKNIYLQEIKNSNPNILLSESEKLANALDVVNQYKLDFSKESTTSYHIIENPSLIILVDNFIELGLHDFIKENPDIINQYSKTLIDRIRFCKINGISFMTKDHTLEGFMTDTRFYINQRVIEDKELDQFFTNLTMYHMDPNYFKILASGETLPVNPDIKYLDFIKQLDEKYKISELEYSFDGTIISRNKVLRNTSLLCDKLDCETGSNSIGKIVYNSALYGSSLDYQQIQNVTNAIDSIGQKDVVIKIKEQ